MADKKGKNNGKKAQEPEVKYEDRVETLKKNLGIYSLQYYAHMMKSGENGKQGQVNGLFASIYGLQEKGGLEDMLQRLKGQGLESIQNGDGLNAKIDLADVIQKSAAVFQESYMNLRPQDLKDYLKVLKDVEVPIRGTRTIKEIMDDKKASEEDKAYATHLTYMMQNAVLYEGNAVAIREQTKEANAAFMAKYPGAKKK